MFEEVAQALDDGEAEAESTVAAAIGKPIEFAKNLAPVLLRDSRAGVPHFDAQGAAALPAADEHAAIANVLSIRSKSSERAKSAIEGAKTPASSVDMSSKALNSSFMPVTAVS